MQTACKPPPTHSHTWLRPRWPTLPPGRTLNPGSPLVCRFDPVGHVHSAASLVEDMAHKGLLTELSAQVQGQRTCEEGGGRPQLLPWLINKCQDHVGEEPVHVGYCIKDVDVYQVTGAGRVLGFTTCFMCIRQCALRAER